MAYKNYCALSNLQRAEIYSAQPRGEAVQDHAPNRNWQGPSSCTLTWWKAEEQAGWQDAAGIHEGGASQPRRPLMACLFILSHRKHSDLEVGEGDSSKQSNPLSSINVPLKLPYLLQSLYISSIFVGLFLLSPFSILYDQYMLLWFCIFLWVIGLEILFLKLNLKFSFNIFVWSFTFIIKPFELVYSILFGFSINPTVYFSKFLMSLSWNLGGSSILPTLLVEGFNLIWRDSSAVRTGCCSSRGQHPHWVGHNYF